MAVVLAASAGPLAAQVPLAVAGHVRLLGDSGITTVPSVKVTLHRIGPQEQGAVDSAVTGPAGAFRFRVPGDSASIYVVSARYAGIEYFGQPLRPPGSDAVDVVVSDTSSSAPVVLGARHIIVRAPDSTGARDVLDLLSIRNAGVRTRVAPDSLQPTIRLPLPSGVTGPLVREGDFGEAAVRFEGDSALVFAPLSPGEKNLMLSYAIPAGRDRVRWPAPADSLDVLLEEVSGATVSGAGLVPVPPATLLGMELRRWQAVPPTGPWAEARFDTTRTSQRTALVALVVVLVAATVAGAVVAFRRRVRAAMRATAPAQDPIDAIARLDARYAGRRTEVGEEAWAEYQRERARLKAAAEAALAARGHGR